MILLLKYWKVVAVLAAILSVLGGIAYIRYDAASNAISKQELKIEREKSKFKDRIGEKNNEAERNRPTDRDELIDRLRKHQF